jgi:uncharacterized protein YabN with tetrapyrrole methylase and pyrophosphatase domain
VEKELTAQGKNVDTASLDEMEELWQKAKTEASQPLSRS